MRPVLGVLLVVAAALFVDAPPARADFAPASLGRRIVEADAIAVGRIDALEETHYLLAVERWIHGDTKLTSIRVKRFHDWTCAQRPVPYAVGQRMVVFLDGGREGWEVIGAGCEGEVLLSEGKARVIFAPIGPHGGVWPEEEFVTAVDSYRALHRKQGEDGWVEAWHRLLAHPSPIVVTTAMDDVRSSGLTGGGGKGAAGAALGGALWALLESGPPEVRASIARHPDWSFGPDAAALLPPRLGALAREGRGALGLAARIAMASLRPNGRRMSDLIDSLGDPAIPIEDRRAVADEFAIYTWSSAFKDPLSAVAAAAARTLRREADAEVQIRLLRWLSDQYRTGESPWSPDPTELRERWLPRLDAAAAEAMTGPADVEPDDPLLTSEQAAVAIPAEVPAHERAAVAWTVRAIRRARNAEAAGDPVTARREYGTALAGLFGGVEAAARALGADPAFARERLAALDPR